MLKEFGCPQYRPNKSGSPTVIRLISKTSQLIIAGVGLKSNEDKKRMFIRWEVGAHEDNFLAKRINSRMRRKAVPKSFWVCKMRVFEKKESREILETKR